MTDQTPSLGIDVSAWQDPAKVDWASLRLLGFSWAYIRGVKMGRELDVRAVEHVARARNGGFRVGLYLFFHPARSAGEQLALAYDAHSACGIHPGDLAPALDVESIPGGPHACPAWVEPAVAILEGLSSVYSLALRYHDVADWIAMGRPQAFASYPLFLADYTPPADLPCVLWQQRSAPIDGYGSEPLDQSAALGELPTIGPRLDRLVTVEPSTLPQEVSIPWPRWDRAAHDRLKHAAVRRATEREPT